MGMFAWNKSKLARIAELEQQNRELQEIRKSLAKERDDLKARLDDCLATICKLHERVAVFENAIRTAVSIAGL